MASLKNKFVRILESDDWIIDYCKETNRYRVSYFEDNHFVDDILFDAYEEKEIDNRINEIIDYLEVLKLRFKIKMTKQRLYFDANSLEYLINLLINWIKEL